MIEIVKLPTTIVLKPAPGRNFQVWFGLRPLRPMALITLLQTSDRRCMLRHRRRRASLISIRLRPLQRASRLFCGKALPPAAAVRLASSDWKAFLKRSGVISDKETVSRSRESVVRCNNDGPHKEEEEIEGIVAQTRGTDGRALCSRERKSATKREGK